MGNHLFKKESLGTSCVDLYTPEIILSHPKDIEKYVGRLDDDADHLRKFFPKGTKVIIGDENNENKFEFRCKKLFIIPRRDPAEKSDAATCIFKVLTYPSKRLNKLTIFDRAFGSFSVTDTDQNYWTFPLSKVGKCIYVV